MHKVVHGWCSYDDDNKVAFSSITGISSLMYCLAGDIGGTNARLLLLEADLSGEYSVLTQKDYLCAGYPSLTALLQNFLAQYAADKIISVAAFGVAGPVADGFCKITNLPWQESEQGLQNALNVKKVILLNDFIAASIGVSQLTDEQLRLIYQPENYQCEEYSDAMIIGAGTGLGVAHRVQTRLGYQYLASESGHASFAPVSREQIELHAFLFAEQSPVYWESVLSGTGLLNIYRFICHREQIALHKSVAEAISENNAPAKISELGLSGESYCQQALEFFVRIYASATAEMALHYYPIKRIYLCGGIAPKLSSLIMSENFVQYYLDKGVFSTALANLRIDLVTDEKIGLQGALYAAIERGKTG